MCLNGEFILFMFLVQVYIQPLYSVFVLRQVHISTEQAAQTKSMVSEGTNCLVHLHNWLRAQIRRL